MKHSRTLRTLVVLGLLVTSAKTGDRVVAVGGGGTILDTDDGGTTWALQPFLTSASLEGVFFLDATRGRVVGDKVILVTEDGGRSWTATYSGGRVLRDAWFTTASTGWAVGTSGTILKTDDGGTTWSAQVSGVVANLESVVFDSLQVGWAAGDKVILKTEDGGDRWRTVRLGGEVLHGLHFADSQHGWAVGNAGIILQTANAGESWLSAPHPTPSSLMDVLFRGSSKGWIVGDKIALRTLNAGSSWSSTYSGGRTLNAVAFKDDTSGWAVGGTGSVLRTQDGGASWTSLTSVTNASLEDVSYVPASAVPSHQVTMVAGTGGTVSPGSGLYPEGARVTIRATPAAGYSFLSWTGSGPGSYTGVASQSAITVLGPITQAASFAPVGSVVYVDASAPAGGNGTSSSPVRTVGEGASLVLSGGTLVIRGGAYPETLSLGAGGKAMTLTAVGGAARIGG